MTGKPPCPLSSDCPVSGLVLDLEDSRLRLAVPAPHDQMECTGVQFRGHAVNPSTTGGVSQSNLSAPSDDCAFCMAESRVRLLRPRRGRPLKVSSSQ